MRSANKPSTTAMIRRCTTGAVVFSGLLRLGSCQCEEARPPASPEKDEVDAGAADNVDDDDDDDEGGALFEMDTSTAVFDLAFAGDASAQLQGVLADDKGRREILFRTSADAAAEVVFSADWHLPAAGAMSEDGSTLVCVNTLAGVPSAADTFPDPRQGVVLSCRSREQGTWAQEIPVSSNTGAWWLMALDVVEDGVFTLTYSFDQAGTLIGDNHEDDAVYRVIFSGGEMGVPEMIQSLSSEFNPD